MQFGSRRKRERTDGDEADAFSRHSRLLLGWHPGERSRIKRKARRRERHEAKEELQGTEES